MALDDTMEPKRFLKLNFIFSNFIRDGIEQETSSLKSCRSNLRLHTVVLTRSWQTTLKDVSYSKLAQKLQVNIQNFFDLIVALVVHSQQQPPSSTTSTFNMHISQLLVWVNEIQNQILKELLYQHFLNFSSNYLCNFPVQ